MQAHSPLCFFLSPPLFCLHCCYPINKEYCGGGSFSRCCCFLRLKANASLPRRPLWQFTLHLASRLSIWSWNTSCNRGHRSVVGDIGDTRRKRTISIRCARHRTLHSRQYYIRARRQSAEKVARSRGPSPREPSAILPRPTFMVVWILVRRLWRSWRLCCFWLWASHSYCSRWWLHHSSSQRFHSPCMES